jgi:DDE superfamily endonuclease
MIPSSWPNRPRSSGFTSIRRTVPWCLRRTRSRTSRPSNAPRAISGWTTLFAALNVATGEVKAAHYKRHRWIEFLDFMNRVAADHPGREIHVALDNLDTHKSKRDL